MGVISINEHQTRLVSRIRWSYHSWTQPEALVLDVFTEFTDHLAVRKVLQGVKGRVEDHVEPMVQANTEFAIYVASALIFLGAVVLILLGPLAWRTWLAGLTAGVAWLIIWYAPVSIWIGVFWNFSSSGDSARHSNNPSLGRPALEG